MGPPRSISQNHRANTITLVSQTSTADSIKLRPSTFDPLMSRRSRSRSDETLPAFIAAMRAIETTRRSRVCGVNRCGLVMISGTRRAKASAGTTNVGPTDKLSGNRTCSTIATSTATAAGQRDSPTTLSLFSSVSINPPNADIAECMVPRFGVPAFLRRPTLPRFDES